MRSTAATAIMGQFLVVTSEHLGGGLRWSSTGSILAAHIDGPLARRLTAAWQASDPCDRETGEGTVANENWASTSAMADDCSNYASLPF
jgi:hypothetical protein